MAIRQSIAGCVCAVAVLIATLGNKDASAAQIGNWSRTCFAHNQYTGALEQVPEINISDPFSEFWGFTSRQPGGGWLIKYNLARFNSPFATPSMLIFLYYHECAHAQFNTGDERVADCEGLNAARRDMMLTPQMFEEVSAAYASGGRQFPTGGNCF